MTASTVYANGAFEMSGLDAIAIQSTPAAWTIVGLAIVAAVAMLACFVGGLVSWTGALLNTSQLEDKTSFIILLVLCLFSFGLVAMIGYLIARHEAVRDPPSARGRISVLGCPR